MNNDSLVFTASLANGYKYGKDFRRLVNMLDPTKNIWNYAFICLTLLLNMYIGGIKELHLNTIIYLTFLQSFNLERTSNSLDTYSPAFYVLFTATVWSESLS